MEKATRTIKRGHDIAWLEIVKWCISERAKLIGAYEQPDDLSQKSDVDFTVVEVVVTSREEAKEFLTAQEAHRMMARAQNWHG